MRRSDLKGGTEVMKGKVHCLFVYGTLLSGFENHQQLRDALFLGQARTKERYALYANWIPYVTRSRKVSRIRGEVYLVDDATLGEIDLLEGHPDWYKRELVEVVLDGSSCVSAWIYFNESPSGQLIESGDYSRP